MAEVRKHDVLEAPGRVDWRGGDLRALKEKNIADSPEVEVERAPAALLGMQVHLPGLAQGVRLDEMPLVVHMEAVIVRMVLQIRDISRDVDDSHRGQSLPGRVSHLGRGGRRR